MKMTPVSICRKAPADICQMSSTKRVMPVILYLPNNFLLLSHDRLRGGGYIKFDHVETVTNCFNMKMVISQKIVLIFIASSASLSVPSLLSSLLQRSPMCGCSGQPCVCLFSGCLPIGVWVFPFLIYQPHLLVTFC